MFESQEGAGVSYRADGGSVGMVTSRRTPALRSQSIGVGLLAVRARAAVKRAISGQPLTERDTAELVSVREVLDRTAEALRYGRASQVAPGGRQLASVGLALSSITPPREALNREHAADVLGRLVADIDKLLQGSRLDDQTALQAFLTGLLRTADRDTAQSGEVLVRNP
jgi:hypothetical protein